jgi:hypothetical protein
LLVDLAATLPDPTGNAINRPLPYATEVYPARSGVTLSVHTTPSAEVAPTDDPDATATKNPLPYVILVYVPDGNAVPGAQDVPVVEVAVDPVLEIDINFPLP